jgi:hypothetical protein
VREPPEPPGGADPRELPLRELHAPPQMRALPDQ